jgi:hypothetical protein
MHMAGIAEVGQRELRAHFWLPDSESTSAQAADLAAVSLLPAMLAEYR